MRLALRELRRRPGRFAVAAVILTLISILLMFLGGLLDGLIANSTGAIRVQQADALVYSSAAQESLVRSRIEGEVRSRVEEVVGASRVGGLGSVQLGGRLDGRGPRDLVPVVLFGYELAPRGLPEAAPGTGEVYADESLRREGIEEGTVVRLGPARSEVVVVGFVDDSQYAGQGTLWGSLGTWRQVVAANRPAEVTGDDVVPALVVRDDPQRRGEEVGQAIDAATEGATRTLSLDAAIEALPGVSQQRNTFNQIIGVTVLIALVVVALFFALLTIERVALYGVLKAVGASSTTLFAGVVVQAAVVALVASLVGAAATLVLDAAIPAGSIPFVATPARIASSLVIVVAAAVAGCAFSLRRVLRIDPATAIGGSQ